MKSSKKTNEADPKKLQFYCEFAECLDKEQDGICDFGEEWLYLQVMYFSQAEWEIFSSLGECAIFSLLLSFRSQRKTMEKDQFFLTFWLKFGI